MNPAWSSHSSSSAPGFLGGRRYLEGVEDCAHGVINAGEYDGFHDPLGTECCFCLTVERLAGRCSTESARATRWVIASSSVGSCGNPPLASVRTASSE